MLTIYCEDYGFVAFKRSWICGSENVALGAPIYQVYLNEQEGRVEANEFHLLTLVGHEGHDHGCIFIINRKMR